MSTYAEREFRRHAWRKAHPVETTAAVQWIIDMPVGNVEGAQAPDKEKRTHPLLLGIAALAPVWLPLWGIYLIRVEWNRRRRARGTCLTYDPALRHLKG